MSHPASRRQRPPSATQFLSMEEAAQWVQDEDTLVTSGFVGTGFAEGLACALEQRFLTSGTPRALTLLYAAGQGDGKTRGLNHFAHQGMVRRVIGGHWGLAPGLGKMALAGEIEGYNLPQGVISRMFRDIAAGLPGTWSHVGLETFVDPLLEGGKINEQTREDIVQRVEVAGQTMLFYKAPRLHVAFLRGTTADIRGNITMEREALIQEARQIATAVHNSGGRVIVQVERIAEAGALSPRDVIIPGVMVDAVVLSQRPSDHDQTFGTHYNPAFSGEVRVPLTSLSPMPLNARKVIARRAALEISAYDVINLGIGMPEGVAQVANEEGLMAWITLTAEPGTIGGVPAGGLDFGASTNPEAIVDQPAQFDFYDGGGLDLAILGMAQADQHGHVNVSRFGDRLAGAGGFINISQNAQKVVFVGSFVVSREPLVIQNGQITRAPKGEAKIRPQVEQRTFSGRYAATLQQEVLYVTERCVFRLHPQGLLLTEIAPGVDLQDDILSLLDFSPHIAEDLKRMDTRIFQTAPMGLLTHWEQS